MIKILTWPRLTAGHNMKMAINNIICAETCPHSGNFVETSPSLSKVKKHIIVHLDQNICDVFIDIRVRYVQILRMLLREP